MRVKTTKLERGVSRMSEVFHGERKRVHMISKIARRGERVVITSPSKDREHLKGRIFTTLHSSHHGDIEVLDPFDLGDAQERVDVTDKTFTLEEYKTIAEIVNPDYQLVHRKAKMGETVLISTTEPRESSFADRLYVVKRELRNGSVALEGVDSTWHTFYPHSYRVIVVSRRYDSFKNSERLRFIRESENYTMRNGRDFRFEINEADRAITAHRSASDGDMSTGYRTIFGEATCPDEHVFHDSIGKAIAIMKAFGGRRVTDGLIVPQPQQVIEGMLVTVNASLSINTRFEHEVDSDTLRGAEIDYQNKTVIITDDTTAEYWECAVG